MLYSLTAWPLRRLALGFTLTLAAGGCTQNPPGPVITATTGTGGTSSSAVNATPHPYADYSVQVWSDEFNDSSLDATKWSYEIQDVWFNNELEATTNSRNNVTLTGGMLNITAIQQNYNGRQYTSGRINTKGKQQFTFGRIDVRAKLPKGKGMWPAIWMLGANDSQASWPACGEIDIMELKGSSPSTDYSTVHYGSSVATHQYKGTVYALPSTANGDFSTDFHVFSCVRSMNQMDFYVDGNKYYTLTSSDVSPYPFNNPFYAILNLAVGGDFDGNPDGSTTFPQTMQVDYVRFFQYKE
ncbi:glycoside hydrolase family 16 protein [Hymenobacter baengnokdamensis]|uniref:glycoside hydrolase family 16 protein n=1 Tax=Hymenobacter baengnokdamensis TaxID=2615203 RepID=UPI0012454CB0|nr:glycoside hydrolase family 16 protein [Hymenobacter baengnokdamensis]